MSIKVSILLFISFYSSINISGQKANDMIGQQEFEVTTSFLVSHYSEFGITGIYRKPLNKVWKAGGGIKLAYGSLNERNGSQTVYLSVLLDITRYIDNDQKWSINLQPEYYFRKRTFDPYSGNSPFYGPYTSTGGYKMGFSFSIGGYNRTIISKKLHLIFGFFNSYQYVRKSMYYEYQSNPGQPVLMRWNKFQFGGGVKLGLAF